MKQCCLVALIGAFLLLGCKSLTVATNSEFLSFFPVAMPLQPSVRHEVSLVRIDHLIQHKEIANIDKARLYFERGMLNYSLGLRGIAQIDFDRSLFFDPTQPEIYNLLGVLFTQDAKFDLAYDAFDSALELNDEHQQARRNRGITLYYAGRYHLAIRDLTEHYKNNINDPVSAIWLYLAEREHIGEKQASENLVKRHQNSDQSSVDWDIARVYLGEITEQEYLIEIQNNSISNEELAKRLAQGYFYLAKRYQVLKQEPYAILLYKLALASNAYELEEHRYSILELNKISEKRREQIEAFETL